ncbi:hypothetical protein [Haloarcula marismortui]|uniref:Uncharacterized protein n=1 Tax=Haloarcula marismortui ATCC 33799 TaxID=662475 RepID=M0K5S7_9EURY|nr:hypothetical protein [Haloarcula californiae]EMA16747.1 hypothetical protein C435_12940 [Haloarcula californiae ATCC 33799]
MVLLSGAKQGSKDEPRESFGGEKGRTLATLAFGEPLTPFADSHYASVTTTFDIGETQQEMQLVLIPGTGGVAAGYWPPCPSPVRAMKRAHGHQ